MAQKIVEIADLKTGGKNDELVTYALGSCVGICMYDEGLHIGGLLHAMLPDAYAGSMEHMDGRRDMCPERYVNTGIENIMCPWSRQWKFKSKNYWWCQYV